MDHGCCWTFKNKSLQKYLHWQMGFHHMGHTGISTSSALLAWLGSETGVSPKHSVFAACEMLGCFPIQSHLHSSHGMNLQFSACRNSVTKLSTNMLHCIRNLIRWLPKMKDSVSQKRTSFLPSDQWCLLQPVGLSWIQTSSSNRYFVVVC